MPIELLEHAKTIAANSLRKRAYILLLGIFLLAFGTVSFWSLLFSSASEIVYEGKLKWSICSRPDVCFARYELNIGNTGSAIQDKVVAVVQADPAKWAAAHRIEDLAGDRPRAVDPRVKQLSSGPDVTYEIENLAAGATVIFSLDCNACSVDDIRRTKETPVAIQATGNVLQGEPRVTTLGRRLKLLFAF